MLVTKLGKRILPLFVCAATFTQPQTIFSQELRSLLFSDEAFEPGANSKPAARSPKVETESIRERFKDGKVHIERQVTLDGDQNYVNHGNFTEWSAKGDIVASGVYEMGERQGPWIKFYQAKDAALFSTQPYARFKAPFQSSVEFKNGRMEGMWEIKDADNRTISQIQLVRGIRDGKATWFHANGQPLYQADYQDGILDGVYVEKTADGKVVRQDTYVDGRRSETAKEYYPSKALRTEVNLLSSPQVVVSKDDWDAAQLATYSSTGEKVKHGSYRALFENGQLMTVGTYDRGSLTGSFESWHANGEKAASGNYMSGLQNGTWNWWHDNGMRKATANYNRGAAAGEILAWSDAGKRIAAPKSDEIPEAKAEVEFTAKRIIPANAKKLR